MSHEHIPNLSAEEALQKLKNGNRLYLNSKTGSGDVSPEQRQNTCENGQHPYAIIITCSDSRVIPESVFNAGIGELFVIRVAGNVMDDHQLGSVEYAASHLGVKLIVVMGHNHCGAVDAAIHHDPDGYIKFITDEIRLAVGDETDEETACRLNVRHSIAVIENSLAIHEEEAHGLKVIGALYRLEDGTVDFSQDFFGKSAFLTVSGQLQGEIMAQAFGKIYTFGPTFRAENSNTPRHLAEFWMIEPEMAFYDIRDNMALAEDFIKSLVRYALDNCYDDLKFLNDRYDPELIERLKSVVDTEFKILTYTEGIEILEKAVADGHKFEYPVSWGVDLQSEHERYLVEQHFGRPVILTDYPKDIKAFYMKQNEDGRTVRAMDVLFPKIGEIIGGSEREASFEKLDARIDELGMSRRTLEWYLDTRRFGSCPHSGFGLGFERLLLFVTGMQNIRDVIPFPRTPKNAEF